jgi:squalene-hopene/tetraprenyl-beta-curcumene cyclase
MGPSTASQTAWAIIGLLTAGEINDASVERGIKYLLKTQNEEGTWDEDEFTATGFPRFFYLKYHLYKNYFPLLALATYRRVRNQIPENSNTLLVKDE